MKLIIEYGGLYYLPHHLQSIAHTTCLDTSSCYATSDDIVSNQGASHDFNHLEQEVGPAVAVNGVALVAVVLLLGVGAPSDHEAALLPRPRLQGALSE